MVADAGVVANLLVHAIIAVQARAVPGDLALDLEDLVLSRPEIHQAAGMISARLGLSVGDAMARLKAQAYVEDRRVGAVAIDVVAGRDLVS